MRVLVSSILIAWCGSCAGSSGRRGDEASPSGGGTTVDERGAGESGGDEDGTGSPGAARRAGAEASGGAAPTAAAAVSSMQAGQAAAAAAAGAAGAAAPAAPSAAALRPFPWIGPPSPKAPSATLARFKARKCGARAVKLGKVQAGRRATPIAAFGPAAGLAAWSPDPRHLVTRRVDRAGKPLGPAQVLEVPAPLFDAYNDGLVVLDHHYLAFLAEIDYSTATAESRHYALLLDAQGKAVGAPLRLATEGRTYFGNVSAGAARGALVFSGAWPALKLANGRLIAVYVNDQGELSQAFRDYPVPVGNGADFSLGDARSVARTSEGLIVDGELRPFRGDAEPAKAGFSPASTFTGESILLAAVWYPNGYDKAPAVRYGQLALDGTRRLETQDSPPTTSPRAPFEDTMTWSTGSSLSGDGIGLSFSSAFSDVSFQTIELTYPGINAFGLSVVWSGDQMLILYSDGEVVWSVAAPCSKEKPGAPKAAPTR